jgi:hypothetical protein
MRFRFALVSLLLCYAALDYSAIAAPDESAARCPINLNRLELRYGHAGGQSVPQLKLDFTNLTGKTIEGIELTLYILDSQGNPHPYSEDLAYHHEIAPGTQLKSHIWLLDAASVDIFRTGESLTLRAVQFADGTTWKDDGSQACKIAVDYHAK